MVIGFIWYGPLFGKSWMELVGLTKKDIEDAKAKMPLTYAGMMLTSLVQSVILSQFISSQNAVGVLGGIMVSFFAWLGFTAAFGISSVLFSKKPFKLFAIETGYQLVFLLVAGALIASWQ